MIRRLATFPLAVGGGYLTSHGHPVIGIVMLVVMVGLIVLNFRDDVRVNKEIEKTRAEIEMLEAWNRRHRV